MYNNYDLEKLLKDLEIEFMCGGDRFTPNDIQELIDEKRFDRGYIEQRLIDRFVEINQKFEESEGYIIMPEYFLDRQLDIWVRNEEK